MWVLWLVADHPRIDTKLIHLANATADVCRGLTSTRSFGFDARYFLFLQHTDAQKISK
jgi:hypothetical protein